MAKANAEGATTAGMIAMLIVTSVVPAELLALILNCAEELNAVGVPLKAQLVPSSAKPTGNAGDDVQVVGVAPFFEGV